MSNESSTVTLPPKLVASAEPRVIELHFASGKEGQADENFVVIPPNKEGRLESVEFEDVKLIRRKMTTENQFNAYEVIQAADPKTGIPPFKYGDPNNSCGIPEPAKVLECPPPKFTVFDAGLRDEVVMIVRDNHGVRLATPKDLT